VEGGLLAAWNEMPGRRVFSIGVGRDRERAWEVWEREESMLAIGIWKICTAAMPRRPYEWLTY